MEEVSQRKNKKYSAPVKQSCTEGWCAPCSQWKGLCRKDNRLGLEPPGHHKSLTMAADQEGQGVGECFSHIGQELSIPGRVTCVRGSKVQRP